MKLRHALSALCAAGMALAGCSISSDPGSETIGEAVTAGTPFTLKGVFDHPISAAYVLCPYDPDDYLHSLGFSGPRQGLDAISSVPGSHESSGIGVVFSDGTPNHVEWFDPNGIQTCDRIQPDKRSLDPAATITVTTASNGIKILHYN